MVVDVGYGADHIEVFKALIARLFERDFGLTTVVSAVNLLRKLSKDYVQVLSKD